MSYIIKLLGVQTPLLSC